LAEVNGRVDARLMDDVADFWKPRRRHWRPTKRKVLMVPDIGQMQREACP
jgi:hypothetical protein